MTMRPYTNKLAATTTEHEVVTAVLDYLSAWSPAELAHLPRNCRPTKRVRDAEDVADCAIELTNARVASADPHPFLLEMEAFFAHACMRLSILDRPRPTAASKTAARG